MFAGDDTAGDVGGVLRALDLALARAHADDLESVEAALFELERLTALLRSQRVPSSRHAAVRAGLDRALDAIAALMARLASARDETAEALASLGRRAPDLAALDRLGLRLDLLH